MIRLVRRPLTEADLAAHAAEMKRLRPDLAALMTAPPILAPRPITEFDRPAELRWRFMQRRAR